MSQVLEDEFDRLLLRLAPDLESQRVGAASEEIQALEQIVGEELPSFYRWFLAKMGRRMGPLEPAFRHFTASSVLATYRQGGVEVDPPYLLIGYYPDPVMPMNYYYDLSQRKDDDALVVKRPADGGVERKVAETLREHLAWTALGMFAVDQAPQRCFGLFDDAEGDAAGQLAAVATDLGLISPITTGPYCALFEGPDVAMACSTVPEPDNTDGLAFLVGGRDAATVRRLLGEIAIRSRLDVNVNSWTPRLSQ